LNKETFNCRDVKNSKIATTEREENQGMIWRNLDPLIGDIFKG